MISSGYARKGSTRRLSPVSAISLCSLCPLWLILLLPSQSALAQSTDSQSLQALGEARLMDELADRGLDSLLDRYFETHRTPVAERNAVKSMLALREISENKKLSNAERQQKIKQIVDGIGAAL